ncbi:preprotein translocase subunit SecY [Acidiphilium sp. AL]|uniref:Protein translocase subunit SecY n=1 Tax=Acidiphilium iwatense TaxID=768198 RepID=A0ABS9DRQ3_9PROT|nr:MULTISPECIES: preprotein translocase subunit SecY [Acidiphilium]MCF3945424.1 preprotein translocase subunit SecY [Acidiphilium iwatense]MCU4158940.1 preprotein translocase subunit SecY [Acidiphilium sp. AL]
MASAAEQLASSLNLETLSKATDLKKRIWFTLGALIVFRLGTYIPIPGVDAVVMEHMLAQNGGGVLGMFNMFTGGALGRMTVFALNIMPYISASIIMQLMQAAVPSLETLKKEGQSGQQKLNQYTRYLTVLIALMQSYGIAIGLEHIRSSVGPAVLDPGAFFLITTVITLTGGTVFLMWLGEQITSRGIGNGSSLIIFSGIVAAFPGAIASVLQLGATGGLSTGFVIGFFVLALVVVAFVVFMERAQRRVLIQYPKRQVGNRMFGGDASHLPMKVNTSGVIPPIFASSLLLIPATIIGFSHGTGPGWLQFLARELSNGQPGYMLLYAALIVFFSYFYTAVVFNPEETADNLKKYGGFVPGIRPGANTAKYFDTVLTRLTTIGAVYLVIVCLIPQFLIGQFDLAAGYYFGGTSLLIVVSVTMDTVAQIQSHLLAHQYEGLIRKGRGRARTR